MPPRGSPDRMGASAVVLYRACRVRAAPRCSAPSYYACARPTKGAAPQVHHRTFREPLICPCHSDAHKAVAPATRTHSLHSREGRPLHNRHCRTSPTVIPAKAGMTVGPQAGGACFTFTTSPSTGSYAKVSEGGNPGWGWGVGHPPHPSSPRTPVVTPQPSPYKAVAPATPRKRESRVAARGIPSPSRATLPLPVRVHTC